MVLIIVFYIVENWEVVCVLLIEILKGEGVGYIMGIYIENKEVICEFGLRKFVFCLFVNIFGIFGGIGVLINLVLVLILGCGVVGGSLIFDNIGVENLFNLCCVVYGVCDLEEIC